MQKDHIVFSPRAIASWGMPSDAQCQTTELLNHSSGLLALMHPDSHPQWNANVRQKPTGFTLLNKEHQGDRNHNNPMSQNEVSVFPLKVNILEPKTDTSF